jgi:hypothetical protein
MGAPAAQARARRLADRALGETSLQEFPRHIRQGRQDMGRGDAIVDFHVGAENNLERRNAIDDVAEEKASAPRIVLLHRPWSH